MYFEDRVNFTEAEHELAKEINDVIEAIVDGEGSILGEAVEALTQGFASIAGAQTRSERYRILYKALLANVIDELEQRVLDSPVV